MNKEFRVGDKVIQKYGETYGSIGTVVGVSVKRKDVRVDFNGYTEVYDKDGFDKKPVPVWSIARIVHLESVESIMREWTIEKCVSKLNKLSSKLTFEQAEKILDILEVSDD